MSAVRLGAILPLGLSDLFALSRVRVVALIHAFFDASFTDKRAGMTVIGGYVAPLEAWKEVEARWEQNLFDWNLQEFHLRKIAHQMGREKGALCALSFARIIEGSKVHGIGAALNDLDWTANRQKDDLDHYFACLDMLLDLLSQHTRLEFPGDDVAIVIDRDMNDERQARGLFAWHQSRAPQFKSFTIGDRVIFRALQCADLAAGHWRRAWLEQEFGSGSEVVGLLTAIGERGRFVLRSEKARQKAEKAMSAFAAKSALPAKSAPKRG